MAHEQPSPQPRARWTKIFTAFKVALDIKKLLLAAAGILLTALGWQAIGWTFHGMRSFPEWSAYEKPKATDLSEQKIPWSEFKARRTSWNLLHELAGAPTDRRLVDAADVTNNLDEFLLLHKWEQDYGRLGDPIYIKKDGAKDILEVPNLGQNQKLTIKALGDEAALQKLRDKSNLKIRSIDSFSEKKDGDADKADKVLIIDGVWLKVLDGPFETLKSYREGALDYPQIEARAAKETNQELVREALHKFNLYLREPQPKVSGKLRTWPWSEYRGENPYLIVTGNLKTGSDTPYARTPVINWLFNEQAPVLLEPIYKFLMPLAYLFDMRAGFWDRVYLIALMLWTLVIWGFFGGAICRLAAVQVARNERITLREALLFTRERFVSYVVAPIFPLILIGILVFVLMLFGWLEWIPIFGDIFVAGLFWPIVLIIGFIMAVVLLGLVGWPLMNATISTEGSDSFDALSRSYSYVYGAPWHYLWYSFLAIVYGAVLVFFVGFMASMMVFLGKWGVGSAPGLANPDPASDREPSYLFYYAPTSFGWRDLLISNSRFSEVKLKDAPIEVPSPNNPNLWRMFIGERAEEAPRTRKIAYLDFKDEYLKNFGRANQIGAFLVAIWIYLLFLLVVGFGYSYFWSVSTIIYFLMRHHVDDTPMDEVHLEEEGMDDPFLKPTTSAATPTDSAAPMASATAPVKPGTLSLNVIDTPASTASSLPLASTPPPSSSSAAPLAPAAPPLTSSPLAPSPLPPREDVEPRHPAPEGGLPGSSSPGGTPPRDL